MRTALTSLAGEEGYRQIESGHGRHEYCECHVRSASEIEGLPNWPGLKTVAIATSYSRNTAGHEILEHRHCISSAVFSSEDFAQSVRSHWNVESRLHWVLDIAFREDACKISRGHSANNLATLRHVAANQLRRETSKKAGICRKQRISAMDIDYMEGVIHA